MPKKTPQRKAKIADLLLERSFATSIAEAQAMILAGEVIVDDQRVDKPGTKVPVDASIRLKTQTKDVSRGAEKLRGALEDFVIAQLFKDAHVLDIGSSTGGFTQVALECGATSVDCVDVGTNVLDYQLRKNPRITVFEKTHIEKFTAQKTYDLIVVDVSFISLARLAATFVKFFSAKTQMIALVKPQFELEAHEVDEGGIVEDIKLQKEAILRVKRKFNEAGLAVIKEAPSRLKGRGGNQEYFILARMKGITR